MGMRRPTSAVALGESFTATSRLLLAERVRVTRPSRTRRVTSRDKVEASMLVRSARSIWRCWPALASTAMHPPHGDAKPMRRQRFRAELVGDDGADPVDQIGQVIAEIDLRRGLRHGPIQP